MQKLPRPASDLLAIAELVNNPEKLKEAAAVISSQAAQLADATAKHELAAAGAAENQKTLEAIESERKALDHQRELLEQDRAVLDATGQQYKKLAQELESLKESLYRREEEIAKRDETVEAYAGRLAQKELDLIERENELNQALKDAAAEHEKWKRANAELRSIVNKEG